MSSNIKSLYELISQSLLCQERLDPYKMNDKQIFQVFNWLDQRRRGFVDVTDFYAKFQQLTQDELFYVFKYLDVSRKGAFTRQNIQQILSIKNQNVRNLQDDPIKNFTNLIKVIKATYHLIEQQKQKLCLSASNIQQIFNQATLKKKDKIQLIDFLVLFRQLKLTVNQKLINYLKDNFFGKVPLSLKEFIQAFSQFIFESRSFQNNLKVQEKSSINFQDWQSKIQQKSKISTKMQNIDAILNKYKSPSLQQFKQPDSKEYSIQKMIVNNYTSCLPKRQQLGTASKFYQIFQKTNNQSDGEYINRLSDPQYTKIDQLLKNTNEDLKGFSQINKRRQQLRKGSLERQKIIDDVLNKKKYDHLNNARPGTLYTHNLKIQTKYQPQSKLINYQSNKTSTPTYKAYQQKKILQNIALQKFYEQNVPEKQPSLIRPSSASKTGNSFFDKTYTSKMPEYERTLKPDYSLCYRKQSETPKSYGYDKQNILRRAEEEATKKIQEIQRRARLKVMQKRSVAGVYNRWIK